MASEDVGLEVMVDSNEFLLDADEELKLVAEVEERQSAKQPAKKKLKKATANDDDINIGDTETATHFALEKSLEQVLMEQEEREESGQRSRSRSKIITLASTEIVEEAAPVVTVSDADMARYMHHLSLQPLGLQKARFQAFSAAKKIPRTGQKNPECDADMDFFFEARKVPKLLTEEGLELYVHSPSKFIFDEENISKRPEGHLSFFQRNAGKCCPPASSSSDLAKMPPPPTGSFFSSFIKLERKVPPQSKVLPSTGRIPAAPLTAPNNPLPPPPPLSQSCSEKPTIRLAIPPQPPKNSKKEELIPPPPPVFRPPRELISYDDL